MTRARDLWVRPISEDVLKRIANIFGEHSAAAQALKDAEERRASGQTVAFYEAHEKGSNAILVIPECSTAAQEHTDAK
jgi:hypothetical protein